MLYSQGFLRIALNGAGLYHDEFYDFIDFPRGYRELDRSGGVGGFSCEADEGSSLLL